jgi:parallel beta-helix repeat protein
VDAETKAWASAVTIQGSSNIAFNNSKLLGGLAVNGVDPLATVLDATGNVLGLPTGRGISILNSSGVTISGNDISTFHKGVVLNGASNIVLADNEIHNLRTTPISGGNVQNVTITGNHLHDSKPWNFGGTGDHGDFIHLWTVKGGLPSANIIIRNNFLDQGNSDPLLGIYLDDNGNRIGFLGVDITNNVISNTNAQAIRLENVQGVVSGNTLVQPRATSYHDIPGVLALDGSNIQLLNNLLGRITVDATSTADRSGNLIITRSDPSSPGYYDKVFVNGLADRPTLADLVRLPVAGITEPSAQTPIAAPAPAAPVAPSGAGEVILSELRGTSGRDSLNDRAEARLLKGLAGDDGYVVSNRHTVIEEAAAGGRDSVVASVDFILPANVENLTLTGSARIAIGNAEDNVLKGNELGNDMDGMAGDDMIFGGDGSDRINGGEGNDTLHGDGGGDSLEGGRGNDVLFGGAGDDILLGGEGSDRLTGGSGADTLSGGAGADRFLFTAEDALSGGIDLILDFSRTDSDLIALNAIDANALTPEDDKFAWIGTKGFTGQAGQLRYEIVGSNTYLYGDTNGDGIADLTIALKGAIALQASDLIL